MNNPSPASSLDYETVIVGAGISGIGAAIELQKHGFNSYILLEKAEWLGGTWRDNDYPGIAVDIPSFSYSFAFDMKPDWSSFFAKGNEIQEYVEHIAGKYNITNRVLFNTGVKKAVFDDENNTWTLLLDNGKSLTCRYIISATGFLNQPVKPDIEGLDSFRGKTMHTARWDHAHDLKEETVGIIGTGASAVQVIPSIAPDVKQLYVYQRTPIWVGPKPDIKISAKMSAIFRRFPVTQRIARLISETALEFGSLATTRYQDMPAFAARIETDCKKFLARQVKDPELRKKLTPDYGYGCKRPAISNDYLRTFNRENMTLVTEGIEKITPSGIRTRDGQLQELDTLILATGFKTLEKGNSPSYEVYGSSGRELGEFWEKERYQAYQGITVPDYPNFFLTFGPYTGGLNWFNMLDAHLTLVTRLLKKARKEKATRIEAGQQAHDEYFREMLEHIEKSVMKDSACVTANSYYLDHHGDASAPYPLIPIQRWLKVRFSRLDGYSFS